MIWHKIFQSEEEAKLKIGFNKMYSLRIGLKKICLAYIESGIYAFEDACPHKLVALSKGILGVNGEVTCFWHQYRFDICTGKEMTGKNIRELKVYNLEIREDGLYLALPKEMIKDDEFSF